jgi:hypothetical protein
LDLKKPHLLDFQWVAGSGSLFQSSWRQGVSKAVLIASVTPFQLQTPIKGVPQEKYDGMAKLIKETDSVFDNFGKTFFGVSFINISTPF